MSERLTGAFPSKVLSVFDLTLYLKNLIEKNDLLSAVWVQGEVSNLVKASSGHCYFTLKDGKSVIKAALWAGNRRRIGLDFKNGDQILVFGNISVYAPRGDYQIIVSNLRPAGLGALFEAYEKLKKKLNAEGLFDQERKLPIPFLPKGVGIVTSPTGSVIQDIYRVIRRRFPNMPLFLVPAKVQGEGAANEIAAGIKRLVNDPRLDVIIIGRGGGSLEDLWPFNEEIVARAISESTKPIISAVGHETDTTIADLVADKRAATPSVAGELAVPVKMDLMNYISRQNTRLMRAMKGKSELARQKYKNLSTCRFLVNPSLIVAERRLSIMNLGRELDSMFERFVGEAKHIHELLSARLLSLNPKSLIKRGYIIAADKNGKTITKAKQLKDKQKLLLTFLDGTVETEVNCINLNTGE